jgi:hypothetical protein
MRLATPEADAQTARELSSKQPLWALKKRAGPLQVELTEKPADSGEPRPVQPVDSNNDIDAHGQKAVEALPVQQPEPPAPAPPLPPEPAAVPDWSSWVTQLMPPLPRLWGSAPVLAIPPARVVLAVPVRSPPLPVVPPAQAEALLDRPGKDEHGRVAPKAAQGPSPVSPPPVTIDSVLARVKALEAQHTKEVTSA